MIIGIKNAILHILDANSGMSVYSDEELDIENPLILTYISDHLDKICDDPGMREGQFKENSGLLYHVKQFLKEEESFSAFSRFAAERLYDIIGESDSIASSDLIVCYCTIGEREAVAFMKCDNKPGFIHKVERKEGKTKNAISDHYAIMPSASQRFGDYAFLYLDDFSIKYKPKKINVNGEKADLFADGVFECDYILSAKESFNKASKLAKKITEEYAKNTIDTEAKIKQYVKEEAAEKENIVFEEMAKTVFDDSPSAREEFVEKVKESEIPENIPMNNYVSKRVNKNIKIVTDTGIEISFPAEYYKDDENIFIINNDDGTLSIQINNIGEIINK